MKIRVSAESTMLVAICLMDMLSTLFFVLRGVATEQNPIMAACLNYSPGMFVLVKIASFVPFVIAVEIYRQKNAEFAKTICRLAIVLYISVFVALTLKTNIV